MAINTEIFREYDIRGVVERDLSGDVAEMIGRGYASELRAMLGEERELVVTVGHDNRPTSPRLAEGVIRGITESGVRVIFIGTVPTPILYYAAKKFGTDGGLQITGSHNPPEYNGFKMVTRNGSVYGDRIQEIRRRIEERDFASGSAASEQRDIIPQYIDELKGKFELARPVKVVVDCGNGTGSLVAVDLLRAVGCDVVPLFCESDGTFPNHHPDPVVDENLADLIEKVVEERAAVGIAFDGDADRIGAVDEKGGIIRGDTLLLLYGLDVLDRLGPPQKLIFDVKCSQAIPQVFAARGGDPMMYKTGHSLIKEKMREEGALIAGELSGHICFAEGYYGFDDALYAACRLAELVSRADEPLSATTGAFPHFVSTPEIRIDVEEQEKFAIVDRAVAHFRKDHEVIDIDGGRVLFDGGWGLLRASNTQPVLVMRFEADTDERLATIRGEFEAWLESEGVSV